MVDSTFTELIEMLNDENRGLRKKAVRALGELGDERAVIALISALKDEDYNVKKGVIYTLGKLGDQRAKDPLFEVWLDKKEDIELRSDAVFSLVELGDLRIFQIEEENLPRPSIPWNFPDDIKLHNPDAELALLNIYVYGYDSYIDGEYEIGAFLSRSLLVQVLKENNDRELRIAAAHILGEIGQRQEVELLCQALNDEDDIIRNVAARSLGRIGDISAVEPLVDSLEDETVREAALNALMKFNDFEAIDFIIETIDQEIENRDILSISGSSFQTLLDVFVIPLLEVAESKVYAKKDRITAIVHLVSIKNSISFETLFKLLEDKHEDKDVRKASARAIRDFGDNGETIIYSLIDILEKEKEQSVKNSIKNALKVLGYEDEEEEF